MSFPIGDVPKLQSNWELIKKGLSSWKTAEPKTLEPTLKRTVSETKRREPSLLKLQKSSVNLSDSPEKNPNTISPTNSCYGITNEKIRFILRDTKNFNERIECFSGTSNEDKEYLDIEEVLFYNLSELVQIRTQNTKLKQQKLNAILIIQEKIKLLDLKLQENIEKAIKRIGYNSDMFVAEGKNKSKCLSKNDPSNEAKCKRKRLHFQTTKHSVPLVDEINKIRTSLKSCGESRQNRKTQIFKSLAKLKIPEDKEDNLKIVEQTENPSEISLCNEMNKIKDNLQLFEKNKPNRKFQIIQSLSLLEIPEETQSIESISKTIEDTELRLAPSGNSIELIEELPEDEPFYESQPMEEEIAIPENVIETPPQEFPSNPEKRKFNLVQVLGSSFSFQSNKLKVTNTLKSIQNCFQEAQDHFEYFKNNHEQLISPPGNDQENIISSTSVEQKEIVESRKITETAQENVAEPPDNRNVTALLVQIRLLLLVTLLKLLQVPYEVVAILVTLLWVWERQ